MNNFTFYAPTMFAFGQGEASRVGALVRQFGGSKVLLVAGGGSVKKNGAYDAVAASLKEAGFPWCELWGVQANPRSGKVYEGIDLARTEGVDFLLAIGGGSGIYSSVIDLSGSLELTAKAGSPNGKALLQAGHELDLDTIKDKLGPGAKVTVTDANGETKQVSIPRPVEPEKPDSSVSPEPQPTTPTTEQTNTASDAASPTTGDSGLLYVMAIVAAGLASAGLYFLHKTNKTSVTSE